MRKKTAFCKVKEQALILDDDARVWSETGTDSRKIRNQVVMRCRSTLPVLKGTALLIAPTYGVAMTKADIVDRIAEGTGLTKIETKAVVDGFMTVVSQALKDGERIELRGFGSFDVQHRAPRMARNPQTNEPIRVDERYVPVFNVSAQLQEAVDASLKARPHSDE